MNISRLSDELKLGYPNLLKRLNNLKKLGFIGTSDLVKGVKGNQRIIYLTLQGLLQLSMLDKISKARENELRKEIIKNKKVTIDFEDKYRKHLDRIIKRKWF